MARPFDSLTPSAGEGIREILDFRLMTLDWWEPPHPARLPMKCIGTAAHPLAQGGEGWDPEKNESARDKCGKSDPYPLWKRVGTGDREILDSRLLTS